MVMVSRNVKKEKAKTARDIFDEIEEVCKDADDSVLIFSYSEFYKLKKKWCK